MNSLRLKELEEKEELLDLLILNGVAKWHMYLHVLDCLNPRWGEGWLPEDERW